MVSPIDRDEVLALLDAQAQLVEVMPADEYRYEHLPTALNIPLKLLDADTVAPLARDRPVVVYCYDTQ